MSDAVGLGYLVLFIEPSGRNHVTDTQSVCIPVAWSWLDRVLNRICEALEVDRAGSYRGTCPTRSRRAGDQRANQTTEQLGVRAVGGERQLNPGRSLLDRKTVCPSPAEVARPCEQPSFARAVWGEPPLLGTDIRSYASSLAGT
jgi:hypothetical protein